MPHEPEQYPGNQWYCSFLPCGRCSSNARYCLFVPPETIPRHLWNNNGIQTGVIGLQDIQDGLMTYNTNPLRRTL